MLNKHSLLAGFFLSVFLLSAQVQSTAVFIDAKALFQENNYVLAQNLFHQIYNDESAPASQREEALFHIAICSRKLFNEDAKFWFNEFLSSYPYSSKINMVN